jgi:hypothetical protein
VLATLAESVEPLPERAALERAVASSLRHRRLPRIDGAERAPSAQAKCRRCRQSIARGAWRIRLVFYEDGRFSGGGFLHAECGRDYFEVPDVLEQLLHFSPSLAVPEREELGRALQAEPPTPAE